MLCLLIINECASYFVHNASYNCMCRAFIILPEGTENIVESTCGGGETVCGLALMRMHLEKIALVDLDNVINDFASKKSRRLNIIM